MMKVIGFRVFRAIVPALFCAAMLAGTAADAASSVALRQAVAEKAAGDRSLAAFYKTQSYEPIWLGRDRADRARLAALMDALQQSGDHGLPAAVYMSRVSSLDLKHLRGDRAVGTADAALTRIFLDYARDVQTGVLVPSEVDEEIARDVPLRNPVQVLDAFMQSTPAAFMRALPPQSREYALLMKHKFNLEKVIESGGWGAIVPPGKYQLGDTGQAVMALRNRLVAMGYLQNRAQASFDQSVMLAVQAFQTDHGLMADGVAGASTIGQINISATQRLGSVLAAMERERWMNMPLGERHVRVNIADFRASIIDNGQVTFTTRAVVGAAKDDQRSPEFSDQMEYLVINPSWYVPRSITVKEYLPLLQEDPTAVSHLDLIDSNGAVVTRAGWDFSQFDEDTFPFDLKEPPSQGNALGLVKFMFPNRFNIYLHDTPAKSLFARDRRAFSHGCIRLADPFDFAYEILSRQTDDPRGLFHDLQATGRETFLNLAKPIPVHLDYRTAFTDERGAMQFRPDVYGRDSRIFDALLRAGVALPGLRS